VLRTLLEEIPDRSQKTVLEIGCGSGGNLQLLFGEFRRRLGLDRDPNALRLARAKLRPGGERVAGDANDLKLPDRSFDCVALVDVLYHRAIRDVDEVVRRASAVLRPGGFLLITDGAHDFLAGWHNRAVGSARRFTRADLRRHAEAAGLAVCRVSYWGTLIFFALMAKRMVLERLWQRIRTTPGQPRTLDLRSLPVIDELLYLSVRAELTWIRRESVPVGASVCLLARRPQ
jgi:SAM-dependent methyltransferase